MSCARRRLSQYGMYFWACQRLVDQVYATFGSALVGTWGLNAIYRTFGARVGSNVILRKNPAVSVPDMLTLGNRCAMWPLRSLVCSSREQRAATAHWAAVSCAWYEDALLPLSCTAS